MQFRILTGTLGILPEVSSDIPPVLPDTGLLPIIRPPFFAFCLNNSSLTEFIAAVLRALLNKQTKKIETDTPQYLLRVGGDWNDGQWGLSVNKWSDVKCSDVE